MLVAAPGCGAASGTEGDCNARIVYAGATYETDDRVRQQAPAAPDVRGTGDVVGCDREVVGEVSVHEVRGVPPAVAVAVLEPGWRGVYVREGSDPDEWPAPLR